MLVVADHPGYEAPKALVCRRFIENMQYLCDYGAPKGVSLVIEPLTPMEVLSSQRQTTVWMP
ncbi:MAG: hypothetical protein ACLR0U_32885 [Enterocloster clostridioformis]